MMLGTFLYFLTFMPCLIMSHENYGLPEMMIRLHEKQKYLKQLKDEGPRTILEMVTSASDRAQSLKDLLSRPRVTNDNVSGACMNSILELLDGVLANQTWAFQMFDATAKIESGIFEGNFKWLGSYSECVNVVATSVLPNTTASTELFHGKYCQITMGKRSQKEQKQPILPGLIVTLGGITLGLCVPSTCSDRDVKGLVNSALFFLPEDYQAKDIICQEDIPLDGPAIGVICMLGVLGTFIAMGTLYDILIHQRTARMVVECLNAQSPLEGMSRSNARKRLPADENTPLLDDTSEKQEARNMIQDEQSWWQKLLVGVSVYSNGAKLLSITSSGQDLRVIHGIRFLSMTWVILGHTILFMSASLSNLAEIQNFLQRWTFRAILNGTVSVDTFFLLSGLLVTYLMMTEMKKNNGKLNWAIFYFHRFWRLTPPYMLVLGVHTALFKYLGSGPMWPADGVEYYCPQYWWTNLLYINNLVYREQMCMAWSWYLSNDMQFFVISPLILIPLYRWPVVGYSILGTLLVATITATAVIAGVTGATPGPLGKTFITIYIPPWTRIGPYLIGMFVGYVLYRTDRKVRLHLGVVVAGWLTAAAVNLAVIYGLDDSDLIGTDPSAAISVTASALYHALAKNAWAAGVGWVIFACVTGYGGWINTLLSWPALIPLSRLTYMTYLVHPIIILAYLLSRQRLIYIDNFQMIYLFLGHLFMSYLVAFALSLLFEAPMMGMEKVIFEKKKAPSKAAESTNPTA